MARRSDKFRNVDTRVRNFSRNLAGLVLVTSLIAGASSAGATTSSPSPTVASVTADINSFAAQMARPGYVSYATSAAVKQYVADHGSDHVAFACLSDFPVTSGSSPSCVLGSLTSKVNVVLYGDSHAWQWAGALNNIALAHGWKLSVFSKASCQPEVVTPMQYANGMLVPYPACGSWRSSALIAIAALKPKFIFFSEFTAGTTPSLPVAIASLASTLTTAVGGDPKHVVWIRSTPLMAMSSGVSLTSCLAHNNYRATANAAPTSRCFMTYGTAMNAPSHLDLVANQEAAAATSAGLTIIDPMPWLCQTTSLTGYCPPVILGHGPYFDAFHITNSFAQFMAPLVNALIPAK